MSAEPPLRHPFHRRANGFTLLEMMVALAVFSLAALALVRLQAFGLNTAADLDSATLARIVAQNRAVDLLSDPAPPAMGEASGEEENGGRRWRWTSRTSGTDDPGLVAITLEVRAADSNGGSATRLTIVRPVTQ